MKTCYIIGAGDVLSCEIQADETDYIICADGGYKYKSILGREADLVVGDYDSLGYVPECEKKVVVPCEKDITDMHLAVDEGIKRGYRTFVIVGALGGERMDHSFANIQLLHYIASKGAMGFLRHGKRIVTAIKNRKLFFSENLEGYISVFSLTDKSEGVTIKNLKYEVENFTMQNNYPTGVSNEFIGKEAYIEVNDGVLLVTWNEK